MQRVLIVEDDLVQLNSLENAIRNKYPGWEICTAQNFDSGHVLIQESVSKLSLFTLFLLDVQLTESQGDRSGFFIAKEIRSHSAYYRTPILFLTAISDDGSYALSEFHCYNYISKPYTQEDILRQLEHMLFTGYLENTIIIKDIYRISHKIFLDDIIMVESNSHTLNIHTNNGLYTTREFTLETFEKKLSDDFVQCHRKYIVNAKLIHEYDHVTKCICIGESWVPVGRIYYKKLEDYLHSGL